MKKPLILSALVLVISSGCQRTEDTVQELALATKMGAQTPEFKAFERFAELVKEKSDGTLKITLFGDQVLGTDEAVTKTLQMGGIDIYAGTPTLGVKIFIPRIEYITPPFIYRDFAHFRRFILSDYGQKMFGELEEKGNIIPLNTEWNWKRGYRVICSRKPVESLADLNGLPLRFYPSEFEMNVWRALGAVPNVIAFSETYLALQQGMVQAVTSPSNVIYDMKFVEVCRYITRTNEFPQTLAFYMNKKRFDSLTPELQEALVDSCNQAGREYTAEVDENVEQVLALSKTDYDTVYLEPDMTPFIDRARSFYGELKAGNSMPSEFWDVMAAIEAAR